MFCVDVCTMTAADGRRTDVRLSIICCLELIGTSTAAVDERRWVMRWWSRHRERRLLSDIPSTSMSHASSASWVLLQQQQQPLLLLLLLVVLLVSVAHWHSARWAWNGYQPGLGSVRRPGRINCFRITGAHALTLISRTGKRVWWCPL